MPSHKNKFVVLLFVVLCSAMQLAAQSVQFNKRVYRVNGSPVSSNPTSVTNGDLLDWVLTYQYNPTPAPPAQTNIQDMIVPPLQFVPASLHVPPSWTGQWFNGSWVTLEPPGVTGVGAKTAPNVTPFGSGQTVLIPAPPSSTINTTGQGGDGYRAIPYNGNVYVVNHHIPGKYLDCLNVASGQHCTGFPLHVPPSTVPVNLDTTLNNNPDAATPFKTYEYLDRNNGKLYFAIQKTASPYDFGVVCANLLTMQTCGFTSVLTYSGTSSLPGWGPFQGVGGVNGKVYVQLPTGQYGCVIASTGNACPGQPFTVIPSINIDQIAATSDIIGNNIYTTWTMSGGYRLTCWDTLNDQPCSGAWPKLPNPGGTRANLYRLLGMTGAPTGICAQTVTGGSFVCYDLTPSGTLIPPSGNSLPNPVSYATWVQGHGGPLLGNYALGQPGYSGSRVFNASSNSMLMGCYDFSTPTGDCIPTSDWATAPQNFTAKHYATVDDPERDGCMWSYGDDGRLSPFLAINNKPCGSRTTVKGTITPAQSYCATSGDITGWGQLFLNGITISGGITATLSINDANGNPAHDASGNNYAQNLNVTSFPVSLANIGYGNGPGQYTSLQFVLTFNGLTSNTAWTQTPPPFIEVTWKGGPPEFCFRTRVAGCENPNATNVATAVTTLFNGSPAINSSAPNPPFSATHLTGAECPAKLTVHKSVPGAPAGFNGTFTFTVTCGLTQQQVTITWPNTTVTLPNVAPGTCTVSESPLLPALPAGFSWSGVPIVSPAGGVVHIPPGGSGQVFFTNNVRKCDDRGAVKIEKKLQGVPPGFSGTFTFNVACWSGSNLITQQAQITIPGQSSVTVGGIPTGSTCTITETGPLPALPAGWFWEAPAYLPASGQVSLIDTCCPTITVIDRAKFCCKDSAVHYDQ